MRRSRIALILVCLLASFAIVSWMRAGFNQVDDEPTVDLSAVPYQLGPWHGQDVAMTKETSEVVRADSMINRSYETPEGSQVLVHAAAWVNHEMVETAPHHPEICYPSAGWTELERKRTEIPVEGGAIAVELIHFRRNFEESVTCHWFQMDDYSYRSGEEWQRSRFYGAKSWPNTFKVLLSTSGNSIGSAEGALFDIAKRLHQAMENARGSRLLSEGSDRAQNPSDWPDTLDEDDFGSAQHNDKNYEITFPRSGERQLRERTNSPAFWRTAATGEDEQPRVLANGSYERGRTAPRSGERQLPGLL